MKKRKRIIEGYLKYELDTVNEFENMAIFENEIHKLFIHKRLNHPIEHGGFCEWFNLNQNDLISIEEYLFNI